MPAAPLRTALADTAPNPSNSTFKIGIGALWDFVTGLLGITGNKEDALTALRACGPGDVRNISLVPGIGSNALTMNIKTAAGAVPNASDPVMVSQRDATLGNGDFNYRKISAAVSLVFSAGSTLGLLSASSDYIYYYLLDNAGVQELGASATFFGQSGIVSTNAEGGAGTADSATVMYSTVARANVPFRCVGRIKAPQPAAGNWTVYPTEISLDTGIGAGTNYQRLGLVNGFPAWLGLLPTEIITASAIIAAAQLNKLLLSGMGATTYTLPDITAANGGSIAAFACYGPMDGTVNTIAADASDAIYRSGATSGSIVLAGGDTLVMVADSTINKWIVLALLRAETPSARRNGIRNGGFKVAQRGTSASGAGLVNTFYLDGWYNFGGPSNYSVSQIASPAGCVSPKAMRFGRTAGETQTNQIGFCQSLESVECRKYAGRQITLSFKAVKGANFSSSGNVLNVSVHSGTGTDQPVIATFTGDISVVASAPVLTGALQTFSLTGIVNANCNQLGFTFSYNPTGTAGAADYLDITDIQIEVSAMPTIYEDRSYDEELQSAIRFYRKWSIATGSPVGQFQAVTTSSCNGGITYPRMRAAPTVNISGNFDVQPTGGGSAAVATYGASNIDVESCLLTWNGITGSPLVAGNSTMVKAGGSSYIEFKSEL